MLQILFNTFETSWKSDTFVKLSLSKYTGHEADLINIYIKRTTIKKEEKLSFTYRFKTKDIVKNYSISEALIFLQKYVDPTEFQIANLFTLKEDIIFEYKGGQWTHKEMKPTFFTLPTSDHDKPKVRPIDSRKNPYLNALKITDLQGKVLPHAQDKYKQINHYIEILSNLLKDLPSHPILRIADMGSGKGYLTFALYDYLTNNLFRTVEVTGIELRKELVDLCNQIAVQAGYERLKFIEGSIDTYHSTEVNILIALHACDTATDDAIHQGIQAKADLIVVAPCCHKQIRREIEKNKIKTELDDLIRHGIYLERTAEMITDSIRALILEYHGYTVKVFDFISDAHTPKNIMITAQKKTRNLIDQQDILNRIQHLKSMFGIKSHDLEKTLNIH